MGYKAFASMCVAVIGNEKLSAVLAQGLALADHEVFIGIKEDQSIYFDFLVDEFDNIHVTTVGDAAEHADLIIMAAAPDDVREMAYLLDDVRSKVIIDVSNMNASVGKAYLNTLHAIKAITGSRHLVKCFNAAGFQPLAGISGDNKIEMFVAGDDLKAKETAKIIARDLGFADCHDFGGSDSVPLLDEMAICYHHLAARQEQGEKIAITISRQ